MWITTCFVDRKITLFYQILHNIFFYKRSPTTNLSTTSLDMMRAYVDREEQWKQYLALILYAYNTSHHSSTGTTPFTLIYGREARLTHENLQ